jgi:hypothetical protein
MDADGLTILNQYREAGLDVASILMDIPTYDTYGRRWVGWLPRLTSWSSAAGGRRRPSTRTRSCGADRREPAPAGRWSGFLGADAI